MTTALARQISARMKARNITVLALEREAGLKTHTVRNILRGKSKRPSAENLQAVSDALDCTVKDLLRNHEIFPEDATVVPNEEMIMAAHTHPELLESVVKYVNAKSAQRTKPLSILQTLNSIEEIYVNSLHKGAERMDEEYGEWYMDLVGE